MPGFRPEAGSTDVLKAAKDALAWATTQQGTAVIFDTAGSQDLDDSLIADLEGSPNIRPPDILEAIQYRSLDRKLFV